MPELCISLFGKFKASCGQREIDCFHAQKVRELFCYLLFYRHRFHNRDVLADILWGDQDSPHSRKYLRKSLWLLQSGLRAIPDIPSSPVLHIDNDWIQIDPNAPIWVDTDILENGFNAIRGYYGYEMSSGQYDISKTILQLYKGDFLEGWYQDWCILERERLREMYLTMIDKVMAYCETHSEYDTGIEYGQKILSHDPAREQCHRRLMRLYYLEGNRTTALRQYEICKKSLLDKFGVEPSEITVSLYNHIAKNEKNSVNHSLINNYTRLQPNIDEMRDVLTRVIEFLEIHTITQGQLPVENYPLERINADIK